jgi:flagellin-specific chaperone FliS
MEANAKKSPKMVRQVIGMLEDLLDGWKQIAA